MPFKLIQHLNLVLPLFFPVIFAFPTLGSVINIKLYALLLIILILWKLLRELCKKIIRPGQKGAKFTFIVVITILILLLFLFSLHSFRNIADREMFLLIIPLLALTILKSHYLSKRIIKLYMTAALTYYTVISFLAFTILIYNWSWQAIVIALGISTLVVATELAKTFAAIKQQSKLLKFTIRSFNLLLIIGPLQILFLAYLQQIPGIFLFTVLILGLNARVITQAEELLAGRPYWKHFQLITALIPIIYSALIGGLAFYVSVGSK